MQTLLALLRGESPARASDEEDLEATLALADQEHVLPLAAARIRLRSDTLPTAIASRLDEIERNAAIAGFYWTSALKGVLQAFHDQAVPVVPLKGPFLAERLYGSAALRSSRDLDLLVSEADLAGAEAVLSGIGFTPETGDDYHRPWRRRSTMVELHHDVENPLAFDFHVAGALRRAHPAEFHDTPCLQLAGEDELLYLCLHGVRHRFERLSLVVDLQLAFEKLPGITCGWRPRAEVAELDNLLMLGLDMARRLGPGIAFTLPRPASKRQIQHLESLADRLWNRLLNEPSEMLDWRAIHDFFLEIELPGWPRLRRRYRHSKILATRVIDADYAFAASYGMHHAWQARMLRPIRLISERLHG